MSSNSSFARHAPAWLLLVIASLATLGCGGSDADLAPVSGTITLDGEPLDGAKVTFELVGEEVMYGKSTGSCARGKTDSSGRYTLMYTHDKKGAPIGENLVRITTRDMTVGPDGKEVLVPEKLPPEYNVDSKITREVAPGSNTIDFDLPLESLSGGPSSGGAEE